VFKVIIAGTRSFNDYEFLKQKCDYYLKNEDNIVIVSGKASGADSLGEQYAQEKKYKIKEFPADWSNLDLKPSIIRKRSDGTTYNAYAGIHRNEEMAKYADALILFYDGKSKGSKAMLELAKKYNLKIKVVLYEKT